MYLSDRFSDASETGSNNGSIQTMEASSTRRPTLSRDSDSVLSLRIYDPYDVLTQSGSPVGRMLRMAGYSEDRTEVGRSR